jgi:hypothetical protein
MMNLRNIINNLPGWTEGNYRLWAARAHIPLTALARFIAAWESEIWERIFVILNVIRSMVILAHHIRFAVLAFHAATTNVSLQNHTVLNALVHSNKWTYWQVRRTGMQITYLLKRRRR